MLLNPVGWIARAATLVCAIWAVSSLASSYESVHVGLLTEQDKATIVAAQAPAAQCYSYGSLACYNFTADGNLTPCGASTSPNCNGSAEGACSATSSSYECWTATGGNLAQCPTLKNNTSQDCGYKTTNGLCTTMSGGCTVTQQTTLTGSANSCGPSHPSAKFNPVMCAN